MKRDMELIRKILIQLEESPTHDVPVQLNIEGYSLEEINYNVGIAWKGGLIEIDDKPISTSKFTTPYLPKCLTWQGHDFLDAGRNDSV